MKNKRPHLQTTEDAINWMLQRNLLIRKTIRDPETLATTNGYVLSVGLREKIGANLVQLFSHIQKKRAGKTRITVRDAFLAATISAMLQSSRAPIPEDEMMLYANIVMAILPIGKLESYGIADKQLRTLSRDRLLVRKIQDVLS